MELSQIIYFNKIKFVCKVVENACKAEGISCYSLDEVCDFAFLVNDLEPQLIVINQPTLEFYGEKFFKYINNCDFSSKIVLMTDLSNPVQGVDAFLPLDLEPVRFIEDLKQIFGKKT